MHGEENSLLSILLTKLNISGLETVTCFHVRVTKKPRGFIFFSFSGFGLFGEIFLHFQNKMPNLRNSKLFC